MFRNYLGHLQIICIKIRKENFVNSLLQNSIFFVWGISYLPLLLCNVSSVLNYILVNSLNVWFYGSVPFHVLIYFI